MPRIETTSSSSLYDANLSVKEEEDMLQDLGSPGLIFVRQKIEKLNPSIDSIHQSELKQSVKNLLFKLGQEKVELDEKEVKDLYELAVKSKTFAKHLNKFIPLYSTCNCAQTQEATLYENPLSPSGTKNESIDVPVTDLSKKKMCEEEGLVKRSDSVEDKINIETAEEVEETEGVNIAEEIVLASMQELGKEVQSRYAVVSNEDIKKVTGEEINKAINEIAAASKPDNTSLEQNIIFTNKITENTHIELPSWRKFELNILDLESEIPDNQQDKTSLATKIKLEESTADSNKTWNEVSIRLETKQFKPESNNSQQIKETKEISLENTKKTSIPWHKELSFTKLAKDIIKSYHADCQLTQNNETSNSTQNVKLSPQTTSTQITPDFYMTCTEISGKPSYISSRPPQAAIPDFKKKLHEYGIDNLVVICNQGENRKAQEEDLFDYFRGEINLPKESKMTQFVGEKGEEYQINIWKTKIDSGKNGEEKWINIYHIVNMHESDAKSVKTYEKLGEFLRGIEGISMDMCMHGEQRSVRMAVLPTLTSEKNRLSLQEMVGYLPYRALEINMKFFIQIAYGLEKPLFKNESPLKNTIRIGDVGGLEKYTTAQIREVLDKNEELLKNNHFPEMVETLENIIAKKISRE